ncbi:MAG TPA: NADH-quinone oxidoreductase subunit L, partial [Verrucomicrobiae bacterium]
MILTDLIAIKEKEITGRKKIILRCCMAAGCMSSNSKGVKEQLENAVAAAGLQNEVEARGVGCMKLCCEGPLVAADPQNLLYVRVTAENAPSIITGLKGGKIEVPQADTNSPFFTKQTSIVLANSGIIDPERIESYVAADGYQALHEALHEMTPKDVVEAMV